MEAACSAQRAAARRHQAGLTLIELMFSVSLSGIVIAAGFAVLISAFRGILFVGDHADIDLRNRVFVMQFGDDVKASSALSAITASGVTLIVPGPSGNTTVAYAYDSAAGRLTRTVDGVSREYLGDLTACTFRYYNDLATQTTSLDEVRIIEARYSVRKSSVTHLTPEETTLNARYFRRLMTDS